MLKNELAFIQRRKTAVPGLIIGVDVRLLASYMTITDLCGTFIRKKKKNPSILTVSLLSCRWIFDLVLEGRKIKKQLL